MSHAWTHSWCRSPSRDEAVRASEDGRSGPLPTLEECIERVTERRPVDAGGGGNVTRGLRTERVEIDLPPSPEPSVARVTLEFSGRLRAAPSQWPWDLILSGACVVRSEPGDFFRVVEESDRLEVRVSVLQAAVESARNERDAAIRERDTLRAERITQALTADRFAAAVAEADTLRARVAELEAAPAASGAAGTGVVLPECPFTPESTFTMGWWEAIGKVKKALAAAGVTVKEVG